MDEGLIKYFQECVRIAEAHLKSAKADIVWLETQAREIEEDLERAKLRLAEAQKPNEEAM